MPADEMLGEDKTRHEKAEERRITDLEWALAALLDGVDVGAGLVIADTQRAGSNVRAVFVGYHSQHAVMQARFALGGQAVLCAPSTTAGDSATSAEPTMPASEAGQAVGVCGAASRAEKEATQ